jgi:hypothetical protein
VFHRSSGDVAKIGVHDWSRAAPFAELAAATSLAIFQVGLANGACSGQASSPGIQSDRINGTKRTRITERVRVSLGAIFSTTVSCCVAWASPSGREIISVAYDSWLQVRHGVPLRCCRRTLIDES